MFSYRRFCDVFEKYLPLVVVVSFVAGILISDTPGVAETVYRAFDGFIEIYGLIAPLVIFIILAPSLSRMLSARKGRRGDFISYAIAWLTFRRFLSLIWAVVFTWLVFRLSFYGEGDTDNLITSIKTTGKNFVHMLLTSRYFYAIYLAVASLFFVQRYKRFELFMRKLLNGVEDMGQYLIPLIPAFMLAIGVYVSQLDTRVNDQIISGYDHQIDRLGAVETKTAETEAELATLRTLRAKAKTEPTPLKSLTILGWRADISGDYSMVWVYVLISLVIGGACIIWHLGLIAITKAKVDDFSIKKYFSKYWIKVYPLLWATSSEALATPVNLYLVKRHFPNVRTRVRQFTVGVGSYLNLNGTMICVIVLAGAVASILGIQLTAVQLFLAIPMVFLIGFGIPGIPGELVLFAGPLLQLFDLPPQQEPVFLALYLGLQLGLPDSFRTGNNSTDNCVMAILLNEQYEKKFSNDHIFIDELLQESSFGRLFASKFAERLALPPAASANEKVLVDEQPILGSYIEKRNRKSEERKRQILYRRAKQITNLHTVISSPRGGFFRFRLLQMLDVEKSLEEMMKLKEKETIQEIGRHLRMLQQFSLVAETVKGGEMAYQRTTIGEEAINALRALGRRVGEEAALAILHANFGMNSIRLFLRAYGYKKQVDFGKPQIEFTPFEIASITRFLHHSVEGVSAIDKLNSADILVYSDNGNIRLNPLKARALFQYLVDLHGILNKSTPHQLLRKHSLIANSASNAYAETASHAIELEAS